MYHLIYIYIYIYIYIIIIIITVPSVLLSSSSALLPCIISSSASCCIFFCSLLYLHLLLAISSAPCYILLGSLLYRHLLLAISSSAPCYIFRLLLAICSSAPCDIFFCSLIYLPLLLAIFCVCTFYTEASRLRWIWLLLTRYLSQDNVEHLSRESWHLLETTALVIAAVHYFCVRFITVLLCYKNKIQKIKIILLWHIQMSIFKCQYLTNGLSDSCSVNAIKRHLIQGFF